MKTRKGVKPISHEEVQRAIEKFSAQGGLIKHLPDQVAPSRNLVGSKWAEFEIIGGTGSEAVVESGGESAAA